MTVVDPDDQQPARAALLALLVNLPEAMRSRPQWLLWKHERVKGRDGLQKVPYYVSGSKRHGDLGGLADRQSLASFDDAVCRLAAAPQFTGLGFAFLEGDGLIGIDLDDTIDADTGEMQADHLQVIDACNSYTERTVSGRGVHVIVAGHTDSCVNHRIGVEVYCGGRYFACTGNRWPDTPAEVRPVKPYALAYVAGLVQQAKEADRQAKRAAELPTDGAARGRSDRAAIHGGSSQVGGDFKRVNDAALASLAQWVPQALPGAKTWQDGYRVTSKALGRDLQEDLQLVPAGIMDFGEEQGLSPIDVVCQWVPGMQAPKDALHWLAQQLGISLARPRALRVVGSAAPAREPDIGPDPPPAPLEGEGRGRRARTAGGHRGRGGSGGDADPGGGGAVDRLLQDFALVYGTDQVWDGTKRTTMPVKNLRLLFGAPYVNTWLAHPARRVLMPDQIRFEPGQELEPPCVNLFDGLPTVPVPCTESDCEPILDLLHHLTSLCCVRGPGGQLLPAGEHVFDQVIKWCALIVQRPGAKSRFAMVFHGPQGTGKNLFWDAFRRILGKYGKMVGQTELEDRFNGYMSGKLLLIGNEVVTRQELWHNKNKLKWVITEDEIPIRGMHQEVRWESNHANIVFLSNELMPVALERDDRRHLVVYTPAADDPALYARVVDFLAGDGHAKFMHHLLQVDLGDFNEHTRPMMTEAKAALIELGLKPQERFTAEWIGGLLDLPVRVCSVEQLFRVYRRWAEMQGVRGPGDQSMFTGTVGKYALERVDHDAEGQRLLPALIHKVIQLKAPEGARKAVRCWVPRGCEPPNGTTEGEWGWSSVQSFESLARRFGRSIDEGGDA